MGTKSNYLIALRLCSTPTTLIKIHYQTVTTLNNFLNSSNTMIPVQVRLTKNIMKKLDKLVDDGFYSNRSEIIRDATRRLVVDMNDE